jgi:hypothetical protein
MKHTFFFIMLLVLLTPAAQARGVYQSNTEFLAQAFAGAPPKPALIWLTGALRDKATEILTHPPRQLRVRYWARGTRSVWILNEIGKEKPITVGIVIEAGTIRQLKVLAFRESRGDEVRHEFFTRQYRDRRLQDDLQLDRVIDGITGATLSVRALNRLARLALLLDQVRRKP